MVNEEKPGNTVLDSFSKLTNPHENVRIKSATNLLRHLTGDEQNEKGGDELKYALKRLVRGLGASTSTARIGYFSTLSVLLSLKNNVDVVDVWQSLKAELHKSGKNSDSENADICIGQILTCGALIRSNLWNKCDNDLKKEIIDVLVGASKERSYLGVVGYSFLVQLVDQVTEKEFQKVILPQVKPEIEKPWSEQTIDTLYFLLKLKDKYPEVVNKKLLKKTLGSPEIVCDNSVESLCNILMTIPRVSSLQHPVYSDIVKQVSDDKFRTFFGELDRHLKTPNRNRLLVFIKLLSNTCSYISGHENDYSEYIPELLTENFIKQMLTYFKNLGPKQKDKQYCDAVHKFFEALLDTLKVERVRSKTKIAVLKKLLFKPGTFIFEKRTKSKIVQQITATLDSEGVKELASVYKGVIEGRERLDSDEHWLNMDRLYSAHLLIKLLNHNSTKSENEWKIEQLCFLMTISLFKDVDGVSVGRELAESLKSAFFGALDLKLSKLEDLQTILYELSQLLNQKIDSDNLETVLRSPLTPEHFQLWQKTLTVIDKLQKKKKKAGVKSVFLTLFLHMNLQLFNDVKLASDSLNELHSCYERLKKDSDDVNDPLWIEVVVDLFLNLLSHNSHLLRHVIRCVFPHLCEHMTSGTIHQILSVLDPKNEDPLSKNEDSDSDEESDEGDEPESEADEPESEEEDEDEEEEETANDKLRMALHQALSGAGQSDDESVDLDQMSETEGEKLDEALSNVFKQFKPNHGRKKKQTKDQESLTHFRIRVLDLVDVYLDSDPSMLLALEIMLPLLQAVEFCVRDDHQKPLKDRLNAVLKKLVGSKKFSDTDGVTGDILVDLLRSLLEKGTKNVIIVQDMGEQISDCCVFVVKCCEVLRNAKKIKKHSKKDIADVLSGELRSFFTRRDCLTPYVLFKSILQLSWDGNSDLASILLRLLFDDDVKHFKRNQAAELVRIFYANNRFLKESADKIRTGLADEHETFCANVVEYFKGLCEDPDKKHVRERFICNLFNLIGTMKQCALKIDNVDWSGVAEAVREYRSFKTFSKDAKSAFNKLCSALHVSNVVKMKNNPTKLNEIATIAENDAEATKKLKKKQKKANKEKLKLKKEAKQLRLQSLSQGLAESLDFNEAKDEAMDDGSSESENELKKRKNDEVSTNGHVESLPKKKRKVSR